MKRPTIPVRKLNLPHRNGRIAMRRLLICGLLALLLGCWYSDPEQRHIVPLPPPEVQVEVRPAPPLEAGDFAAVRHFRFHYDVTIEDLPPLTKASVWIPMAVDGPQQRVTCESKPTVHGSNETNEANLRQPSLPDEHGNVSLYLEMESNDQGQIPLSLVYSVQRVEALPGAGNEVSPEDRTAYTLSQAEETSPAGANVDVEQAFQRAVTTAENSTLAGSRQFVNTLRSAGKPAKVELGFVLGSQESGTIPTFDAWAKYEHAGRWRGADMSSALAAPRHWRHAMKTLSPHRVHFTTECDWKMSPLPAETVESFILPHVEVNGQPHAKMKTAFRFEDVDG